MKLIMKQYKIITKSVVLPFFIEAFYTCMKTHYFYLDTIYTVPILISMYQI